MVRRVSTILILASVLFALVALTALGAKSPNETRRIVDPASIRVVEYAFPDEHNFLPSTGETYSRSLDNSRLSPDVAGWKAGDTYYDYQHNSTIGRQIGVGESGTCLWTVHLSWMFLPGNALIDREIVYNGWDGAGGSAVGYYDGLQNPGDYAGYNSLAITDDNRFVVACHNNVGGGYRIHTFFQFQCNVPFHSANMRIPDTLNDCGNTNLANPSDAEVVWPKVRVQNPPDGDRVTHLIGTAFGGGGSGGTNFSYFQQVHASEGGGVGNAGWTFGCAIDTIFNGEGYDLTSSEDGTVAITWVTNLRAECDTCGSNVSAGSAGRDRWDNDLYYQLNRNYGRGQLGDLYDGSTNWWENRVNVTKNVIGTDGYRPFSDLATMISSTGVYHAAWVAMVWDDDDFGTYQSRIFHWSEALGYDGFGKAKLRTVATAQWDPVNCNPGAFNQNQNKLAISECGPVGFEKFYVIWNEPNSPHTTGNGLQDDCAARAFSGDFGGAANGDIFVAVSDDGGLTWDAPRGVTDSYGGPTGNPNGACDPAGAAGPCPSEAWPSASIWGTDYAIAGPGGNVASQIDPSYTDPWYFEVSYVDDPEAGGAINSEGAWYSADYVWIRVPCVEPVSAPGFAMSKNSFAYPQYAKHCEEAVLDIDIENTGNAALTYSTVVTEDPGAHSGWLGITNFDGNVPSGEGNIETGQIHLNVGGGICIASTVVKETGRVTFNHNAARGSDNFEVELYVVDTVILPKWDTIQTGCALALTVGSNGNFGNQGEPGNTLDYSNDVNEWQPVAYNSYIYDGGTTIGWINGSDTTMNWGMFQATIADSVSLIPMGGEGHSSNAWADISTTGEYVTNDSTIGMVSTWYAPLDPDSCGFVVRELKVYSKTGNKTGLTIGEAIDWDVPGDSTGTNNSGGGTTVDGFSVIYQQGVEMPGYDDSLETADGGWDNDQRFGGTMYMGGWVTSDGIDHAVVNGEPYGMYVADNVTYVYGYTLGFSEALLYTNQSFSGTSLTDSIYDLHSGVSYVFEQDLADGDTMKFYCAYATTLKDGYPAKTLGDFQNTLHKAALWSIEHILPVSSGCCDLAGDFNGDASVDISDLTATVDFMFAGGAGPACNDDADINNDLSVDISDLTYRVDFMFGGGPAPVCGTSGSK